ncbi:serine/threonine protein kinase, partial [Myxococcota bacterium]|nr:serine/threonine protein kinase [Myxococcota bacterium]
MEDTYIRDERPGDGPARSDDPTDRFGGMVLEDRYEIRRPLARGGMGRVYVAWDRRLAVEVAVKFLALRDGSTPPLELQQRFETEAKVLARLRDPHILRPLSWGRTDAGDLFMVTELLSGRPLDAALREEGALGPARALGVLVDVCRALVETHGADVMHRDLKPANLFLQRSRSGRETTLVLDFGIAKVRGDSTPPIDEPAPETVPGVVLGTVAYMSPEQARGRPVTPASDLYSLGVVMYECLTGVTPFSGETLAIMLAHVSQTPSAFRDVAPGLQVPEELEALVRWMMEKDPAKRPQSAAVVLARAEALLARLPAEGAALDAPAEQPPSAVAAPTP